MRYIHYFLIFNLLFASAAHYASVERVKNKQEIDTKRLIFGSTTVLAMFFLYYFSKISWSVSVVTQGKKKTFTNKKNKKKVEENTKTPANSYQGHSEADLAQRLLITTAALNLYRNTSINNSNNEPTNVEIADQDDNNENILETTLDDFVVADSLSELENQNSVNNNQNIVNNENNLNNVAENNSVNFDLQTSEDNEGKTSSIEQILSLDLNKLLTKETFENQNTYLTISSNILKTIYYCVTPTQNISKKENEKKLTTLKALRSEVMPNNASSTLS